MAVSITTEGVDVTGKLNIVAVSAPGQNTIFLTIPQAMGAGLDPSSWFGASLIAPQLPDGVKWYATIGQAQNPVLYPVSNVGVKPFVKPQ